MREGHGAEVVGRSVALVREDAWRKRVVGGSVPGRRIGRIGVGQRALRLGTYLKVQDMMQKKGRILS